MKIFEVATSHGFDSQIDRCNGFAQAMVFAKTAGQAVSIVCNSMKIDRSDLIVRLYDTRNTSTDGWRKAV